MASEVREGEKNKKSSLSGEFPRAHSLAYSLALTVVCMVAYVKKRPGNAGGMIKILVSMIFLRV